MSGITLQSASLGDMGENITANHFGTNFLFHSDRVGDGTDFAGVARAVNAGLLRYPGGTVTEEYFDLANPDAEVQANVLDVISGRSSVRERDVEPLDDFLSYCRETGTKAIIVLPTFRYFDAATGGLTQGAEAEIKGFIAAVMRGDYGDVDIHSFEIGNEWYQSRFDWSISEFGALQAQMAVWIDEAITDSGADFTPDIYLQAGRDDFDNGILASFNTGDVADAVDGVISHLYATNSNGNTLGVGGGVERRLKDIAEQWHTPDQPELDLVVTEWNVGENGADTTLINGLMRTAPLLRVFTEMIENGVDLATIWSAQTNGSAGLSTREGDGSDLRPTGHLMQLLSESLIGTTMQDTPTGPNLLDDTGEHVGYTYVFEGLDTTIVYFASAVGHDLDFDVTFDDYMTDTTIVSTTVLGAAAGTTGIEYDARAELREMTNIDMARDANGHWVYEFTLDDYELIQFEFTNVPAVLTVPNVQMLADAQIDGFAQTIGTDLADIMHGDLGNDTLDGGKNHDSLYGGVGDDMIIGGHGRDLLDGGVGNDTLSGGNWHDTLLGGDGDDLLMPGKGADIVDGGLGNDTISYQDATGPVQVDLSQGSATIFGQRDKLSSIENATGSDMDDMLIGNAQDNILTGLDGDDTLDGGKNHDSLYGGVGDDMIIGGHGRDLLDGGVGNDTLSGGNWHDTLLGGDGDDLLMPGKGADIVDGGLGNDTISYQDATGPVQVDLSQGSATIFGQRDKLSSIENATGSDMDDMLIGNAQDNILIGLDGDDTIDGGRGDDILIGGAGSDRFVFNIQSGSDQIEDFNIASDLVDFTQFGVSVSDITIEQIGADTKLSFDDFEVTLKDVEIPVGDPDWLVV